MVLLLVVHVHVVVHLHVHVSVHILHELHLDGLHGHNLFSPKGLSLRSGGEVLSPHPLFPVHSKGDGSAEPHDGHLDAIEFDCSHFARNRTCVCVSGRDISVELLVASELEGSSI